MGRYLHIAVDATVGYGRYLGAELLHPRWGNYLYALVLVSLLAYGLELARPWRRGQPRVREGFWLDAFYMFFNFFLFSLLGFAAVAAVAAAMAGDLGRALGVQRLVVVDLRGWPAAAQLVLFFVLRDFVHYWVHRLLHRVPRLWRFHQVHHSTRQMGFAAQLRFHPFETVAYRAIESLPLAMVGLGVEDLFVVHLVALSIGHLNHANFRPPLGPLRYLFNSPQMHIWHHARTLPRRHGASFGLSLSVWDWVFGTAWWPHEGRDEVLGFPGDGGYPHGFFGHLADPLRGP